MVGRYPVAAALKDYEKTDNPHPIFLVPDALLDFESHHTIVRRCFTRALAKLRALLPGEVECWVSEWKGMWRR